MSAATPAPLPRRQVLVVDDDRDIRETLRDLLELEGFPVAVARNGAEALERMRELRPGLVLLDLFMPVMDGAEVCRRRQADPELGGIPVVVLSAAPDLDERLRTLRVSGHLEKPVRIESLLETVARYCA
jgi:CheY-like chemotaxis protein